jgi:hypothetical protein
MFKIKLPGHLNNRVIFIFYALRVVVPLQIYNVLYLSNHCTHAGYIDVTFYILTTFINTLLS